MKKVLKIGKKIFDVLSWVIIVVLVITVIASLVSRINNSNPSLFGYSIYRVASGSMSPELEIGDVILGKSVDDPMEIEVGDVVTFEGKGELSGKLVTHKVIVAPHEEDVVIKLQTKGVANEIPDSPITADRIVSLVVTKVEFLTAFYDYFFSPLGLLTAIGLIILVFIDELIVMIKTIAGYDNKKKPQSIDEIIGRIQNENTEESADTADGTIDDEHE